MKVGDKIYCIKTHAYKGSRPELDPTINAEPEKICDICERFLYRYANNPAGYQLADPDEGYCIYLPMIYYEEGKVYEVSNVDDDGFVSIMSDNGEAYWFNPKGSSTWNDAKGEIFEINFSDYFADAQRYRKLKLDLLHDKSFIETIRKRRNGAKQGG